MKYREIRKTRTQQRPSPRHGIYSRRLIRLSKENRQNLKTLRFHCNLCKRWLPAIAFYAEVTHPESESSDDAAYLERYEVKAEGFKGRESVVICQDCATDIGQGEVDSSSHNR